MSKVAPAARDSNKDSNESEQISLAYCTALIMNLDSDLTRHRRILRALLAEDLEIAIMESTPETEGKIMVLVDAYGTSFKIKHSTDMKKNDLLFREQQSSRHKILETAFHSNANIVDDKVATEEDLSQSEELALTHRIIQRALDSINIDENGVLQPFDYIYGGIKDTPYENIVYDLLPLHDVQWNNDFYALLNYNPMRDGKGIWSRLRFIYNSWIAQSPDYMHTDRLRRHFGDRLSTTLEFVLFYRKWVMWLTLFCSLHYFVIRFANWGLYVANLGFIGMSISCFWGTAFAHHWNLKYEFLSALWERRHVLHPPAHTLNPNCSKENMNLNERDRLIHRRRVNFLTSLIVVVNIILLIPISLMFTQWYVYGKMAPTCKCCEFLLSSGVGNGTADPFSIPANQWEPGCYKEYMPLIDIYPIRKSLTIEQGGCNQYINCFASSMSTVGTDRWAYIFLQGIVMGLLLDVFQTSLFKIITMKLTTMEGHEFLEAFNKSLIRKQFFFIWVNMFFWYLSITFAYVPFGDAIQIWLENNGYKVVVPPWGWRPNKIRLDEAFVTPVVVTAFVNAIVDTFLPMIIRNIKLNAYEKKSKFRKMMRGQAKYFIPGNSLKGAPKINKTKTNRRSPSVEVENIRNNQSERGELDEVVEQVNIACNEMFDPPKGENAGPSATVPFLLFTSLVESLPEEVTLKLQYVSQTPDRNEMDATDVMSQAFLSSYTENDDFLFVVMQLGYISMFSSAWGLLPLAAACRLMFSFRSICFKVLFSSRRAVPVGSPDIKEWIRCVYVTFLLALPVVSAQFSLATGSLDFIYSYLDLIASNCTDVMTDFEMMMPGCTEITTTQRIIVGFTAEHIVLGVFVLAFIQVSYGRRKTGISNPQYSSSRKPILKVLGHAIGPKIPEYRVANLTPGMVLKIVERMRELDKDEDSFLYRDEIDHLVESFMKESVQENTKHDIIFSMFRYMQDTGENFKESASFSEIIDAFDRAIKNPIIGPDLKL